MTRPLHLPVFHRSQYSPRSCKGWNGLGMLQRVEMLGCYLSQHLHIYLSRLPDHLGLSEFTATQETAHLSVSDSACCMCMQCTADRWQSIE